MTGIKLWHRPPFIARTEPIIDVTTFPLTHLYNWSRKDSQFSPLSFSGFIHPLPRLGARLNVISDQSNVILAWTWGLALAQTLQNYAGERKVKVPYMSKSMRPEIDATATGPYKGQLVHLPKTLNTGYRLVLFPGGMINLSQDANKTQDLMRLYCYDGLGTWTNLLINSQDTVPKNWSYCYDCPKIIATNHSKSATSASEAGLDSQAKVMYLILCLSDMIFPFQSMTQAENGTKGPAEQRDL
ncbi:hypothetical protein VNO77_19742 [Canavalia gladiata]|uniref:Uncharacterized protein n=1 Tax=Canavalia gladiata TaxID=3824 RepID=A0AAN9LRH1_CANGL